MPGKQLHMLPISRGGKGFFVLFAAQQTAQENIALYITGTQLMLLKNLMDV